MSRLLRIFDLHLCDFRCFWAILEHMKKTKEAIHHSKWKFSQNFTCIHCSFVQKSSTKTFQCSQHRASKMCRSSKKLLTSILSNFRYFGDIFDYLKKTKRSKKSLNRKFSRNLDLYNTQLCKNPVLKHFSNFSIERQNVSFVKNFWPRYMRF